MRHNLGHPTVYIQWAVSSPLADLSFHKTVLFYNDGSSSVIISHQLASLFEIELELNSLDSNVNELENRLELEDMKPTNTAPNGSPGSLFVFSL